MMETSSDISVIKKIVSNIGIIAEYDRVVNESSELLRKMNVRIQSGQLKRVRCIFICVIGLLMESYREKCVAT